MDISANLIAPLWITVAFATSFESTRSNLSRVPLDVLSFATNKFKSPSILRFDTDPFEYTVCSFPEAIFSRTAPPLFPALNSCSPSESWETLYQVGSEPEALDSTVLKNPLLSFANNK